MSLTRLLIFIVKAYRFFCSPWLGSTCRFSPTCSAYALQALVCHGAGAGTYLTLRRLARCHPCCAGGDDPVPEQVPRLMAGFFSVRMRLGPRLHPHPPEESSSHE